MSDGGGSRPRERFERAVGRAEGEIDLAEGALLIAACEYPELDVERWIGRLDELGRTARERLSGAGGDVERLAALMAFLYREVGLRANRDDYYDPRNSFLNRVLERRLGIPITLALVALEVGRRAGVPLEGVGFPGHFLIRHAHHREVLIDPFADGAWLAHRDCEELLRRAGGGEADFHPRLLERASPRQILGRMLRNLRNIYVERQDNERLLRVLDLLLVLDPESWGTVRDRGLTLMRHGRFDEGAEDLERYLAERPEAEDRERLERLVRGARNFPTVH